MLYIINAGTEPDEQTRASVFVRRQQCGQTKAIAGCTNLGRKEFQEILDRST
jgi:hypothetical protein